MRAAVYSRAAFPGGPSCGPVLSIRLLFDLFHMSYSNDLFVHEVHVVNMHVLSQNNASLQRLK